MMPSRFTSRGLLAGFALLGLLLIVACTAPPDEGAQQNAPVPAALDTADPVLLPTPTLAAGVTVPSPLRATAAQGAATPSLTPSPAPSPTPTLAPAELIDYGQTKLEHEDYGAAARAFEDSLSTPGSLTREQQHEALWGLALAYLGLERYAEAEETLLRHEALVAAAESTRQPDAGGQGPDSAPGNATEQVPTGDGLVAFRLGQAQEAQGKYAEARASYARYLEANPDMAAYIQPLIARCALQEGDTAAAFAAYEAALDAPADRLTEIDNREVLAEVYLGASRFADAVAQYDAIHDLAVTENTRGQMTYRAGSALLLAGDTAAAYERFLTGVEQYPRAYESYLGLVELIDAGYAVSQYQRGLVDYYAGAYIPAIAAFESHLASNPADDMAYLYLAWSHEALGNTDAALAQLEQYAAAAEGNAARALAEKAALYNRAGMGDAALSAYLELREGYPESEHAAEATWQAALLQDAAGATAEALALYWALVEEHPEHEQAPRALFRAGLREWQNGNTAEATGIWQRLAAAYPNADYGAAAIVWLLRALPEEEAAPVVITATALSGVSYYPLRAVEVARGKTPFTPLPAIDLQPDEAAELAEAEAWMRATFGIEEGTPIAGLSDALRADGRLVRGEKLWQLGLREEARRELEGLREANADNPLATFQLALYFRDLGLYRSSILAAERLMALAGVTVFDAPSLIGRLSYPVYFQELILPLAEKYGYDPLLQFALVRQESLYESFVASHAGAQGLSQVMPGTGDDIARQLSWPDYDNADLYRPYVGLEFGAYYLSQQLRAFDGNVYAALSAYNGGPGSAARWVAGAGTDPDLFLETVDFRETRLYIQRIYTGYAVYQYLYGVPDG